MIKTNGLSRGVFDDTITLQEDFIKKSLMLVNRHSSSFLRSKDNFKSLNEQRSPIGPSVNVESLRKSGKKRFISVHENCQKKARTNFQTTGILLPKMVQQVKKKGHVPFVVAKMKV